MSLGTYQSSASFNKEGFVNALLATMNKNQRGGDFALQKVIEEKQIILLLRSQSLRLVQSLLTVTETAGTGKGNWVLSSQHQTISPLSGTEQLNPFRTTVTKKI